MHDARASARGHEDRGDVVKQLVGLEELRARRLEQLNAFELNRFDIVGQADQRHAIAIGYDARKQHFCVLFRTAFHVGHAARADNEDIKPVVINGGHETVTRNAAPGGESSAPFGSAICREDEAAQRFSPQALLIRAEAVDKS